MRMFRLLLVLLMMIPLPGIGAERVALLIGNNDYAGNQFEKLVNPQFDVRRLGPLLRDKLGFEIKVLENLDKDSFTKALKEFADKTQQSQVSLFFYSGHGFQVDGTNYLAPVDSTLNVTKLKSSLQHEFVSLNTVLDDMDSGETASAPKKRLLFIDACRNNPVFDLISKAQEKSAYGSKVKIEKGLATMEVGTGTLIMFATQANKVTDDGGSGNNSPFTAALLKHLGTPNMSVNEVIPLVAEEVEKNTDRVQRPLTIGSVKELFMVGGKPGHASQTILAADSPPSSHVTPKTSREPDRKKCPPGAGSDCPEEANGAAGDGFGQDRGDLWIYGSMDRWDWS